jgi:glycosyltransferase involved in cell wall biosynthesis
VTDTDLFNPKISDEKNFPSFFSKYNLPNDKKIILYPGRLTKWKGQIEFINILKSLNLDSFICYFIGDDKNKSYKLKLEKEIYKTNLNANCKILGHLSKNDLRLMYKSADIVISAPLQPEGFGRTISEVLAMQKIILCYNLGGSK